jgi:hypothetical protein
MKGRQLVTFAEPKQHDKPCSDCPFARTALRGWMPSPPMEWVMMAHGEGRIECHTLLPPASEGSRRGPGERKRAGYECAGAAIYRSNVCKSPRDKTLLVLPQDKKLVFVSPKEFLAHHETMSSSSRRRT